MNNRKKYFIKLSLSFFLFLFCGLCSSYFYCAEIGVSPGLLYSSATILLFVLAEIRFNLLKLLAYYVLMCLLYDLSVTLTFLSSYAGLLTGIVIAGTGAVFTFRLTNEFIVKIQFKKFTLFFIGAASFVLTEILHFIFISFSEQTPMGYFYGFLPKPQILFGEVFIFWHSAVGFYLSLCLFRSELIKAISLKRKMV